MSGHSLPPPHEVNATHVTSHAHDSLHFTFFLHDATPEQVTSHGPIPHSTSSAHESQPRHSTTHDDAIPQLTRRSHERSPQMTLHGTFGGHITSFEHESFMPQSITQTPSLLHVPFVHAIAQRSLAGPIMSGPTGAGMSLQFVPGVAHMPSVQA